MIVYGVTGLIFIVYSACVVYSVVGWKKISFQKTPLYNQNSLLVSVIVALRNEEKNVKRLIENLLAQSYNKDNVELILVNDHSTDNTLKILEDYTSRKNINVISLPGNKSGKKSAIREGISCAKGELLLFTDADCQFSNNWIQSMVDCFAQNNRPKMLIGLVDYVMQPSVWKQIQRLDFLSLVAFSAGWTQNNKPVMCNAANMAISRDVVQTKFEHGDEIESGDDVFLLHHVKRYFPDSIKVNNIQDSFVYTHASESLGDFFNQRSRWGSKAKHYTD
ncbi:MAG: glycosyltransferase, partial [Bacteroidales bacterium]|nr:glycosyltransferase [Bacteroidales bacterium]